ncbi:hypothetical protein FOZ63_030500 [Perkinsus olseni]|uniref:Uncharacterized protein n=1 Tax=Perkinsus olseni TaxID=32597 RepID=A0A7J6TB44_PEROL|nr:hypothetical protein FOZ60_014798 [Perkinsus olseni]KAF4699729.1 hypothetical protein FOZ63_030500 [Perkinsus olseni]KAF4742499.1 hypothetical protein FOZ62_028779 [Perkinsus olseni]
MQTIVGILCFMVLCSFAVDLEGSAAPKKYSKIIPQPDALPEIKRSVNSGQGGVYERPIGECNAVGLELEDCTCATPAFLADVTTASYILAIICTEECSEATDCPKPPVGTVECQPFGYCLINCSQDEDCPGPDGICQTVDDPKGTACLYKPQY